jgi:hypothetical protein
MHITLVRRYAYFLFSIAGRLLLENLSTTTCKCKYEQNDEIRCTQTTHIMNNEDIKG